MIYATFYYDLNRCLLVLIGQRQSDLCARAVFSLNNAIQKKCRRLEEFCTGVGGVGVSPPVHDSSVHDSAPVPCLHLWYTHYTRRAMACPFSGICSHFPEFASSPLH